MTTNLASIADFSVRFWSCIALVHQRPQLWPRYHMFLAIHSPLQRSINVIEINCRIDGLVQERRNSSASAMELRLSCTNPSVCTFFLYNNICKLESLLSAENFFPRISSLLFWLPWSAFCIHWWRTHTMLLITSARCTGALPIEHTWRHKYVTGTAWWGSGEDIGIIISLSPGASFRKRLA